MILKNSNKCFGYIIFNVKHIFWIIFVFRFNVKNAYINQVEPDNMVLLHEAFSLLAYSDPWDSPVSAQLSVSGREPVCHALNSAILG